MRAAAWFRAPADAEAKPVGAGEFIGRASTAAFFLDDPRVSEAHALVSLRGASLWLYGLRGALACEGEICQQVELRPNMVIEFAPGVALSCERLDLPNRVLAIQAPGLEPTPLTGTCSLYSGPPPRLAPGPRTDADLHLWVLGTEWRTQQPGTALPGRPVGSGDRVQLGATVVEFVELELLKRQVEPTAPALRSAYRITTSPDLVEFEASPPMPSRAIFTGVSARLLHTLLIAGAPVHWTALSEQVWPADPLEVADRSATRGRVDMAVSRLREKLRQAGLSEVHLGNDGTGCLRLELAPHDEVVLL